MEYCRRSPLSLISCDARALTVRNKPVSILASRVEYLLLEPSDWVSRLRALKSLGFTAVQTSVPWSCHEPLPGQFDFHGPCDLSAFLQAAQEVGLWVLLRLGPNIGEPFSGGGLPDWLPEEGSAKTGPPSIRSNDPVFLSRLNRLWSEVSRRVCDFQPGKSSDGTPHTGPLLSVQIEHEWNCGNASEGDAYLGELLRMVREFGIDVPVMTANGFWHDLDGTIETWRSGFHASDLFANIRQLHSVQPEAPKIVNLLSTSDDPSRLAETLLKVIAAGGMPVIDDAVSGRHRISTASSESKNRHGDHRVPGSVLDSEGMVIDAMRDAIPVIRFATAFGRVLCELDPKLDAPVLRGSSTGQLTVPRRGQSGEIIFNVGGPSKPETSEIILTDGRSISSQYMSPGGWSLIGVDLFGKGRLDHTNVSVIDFVADRMIIASGAPGSTARFGINGSEIELVVPDEKATSPLIAEHDDLLIVLCTPSLARILQVESNAVVFGSRFTDPSGVHVPTKGRKDVLRISSDGTIDLLECRKTQRKTRKTGDLTWSSSCMNQEAAGLSPRYAPMKREESMNQCDSSTRFGWYRLGGLQNTSTTLKLHLPEGPQNMDIFRDGVPLESIRYDVESEPLHSIKIGSGCQHLTVLVQSLGGSSIGNSQIQSTGMHEPIDILKEFHEFEFQFESNIAPINPFDTDPFIPECTEGVSSPNAFSWTFTHRRKKPLRIVPGVSISGTWILNDQPLTRSESRSRRTFVISPTETESFNSGKNVLVFRPDPGQEPSSEDLGRSLTIWEIVDTLGTKSKTIAFATNRIPDDVLHCYTPLKGSPKKSTSTPTWYQSTIPNESNGALVIDLSSMSRGIVHLNGEVLGTYDSRDNATVCLPGGRATSGDVLDIFDVEGSDPHKVSIINQSY